MCLVESQRITSENNSITEWIACSDATSVIWLVLSQLHAKGTLANLSQRPGSTLVSLEDVLSTGSSMLRRRAFNVCSSWIPSLQQRGSTLASLWGKFREATEVCICRYVGGAISVFYRCPMWRRTWPLFAQLCDWLQFQGERQSIVEFEGVGFGSEQ